MDPIGLLPLAFTFILFCCLGIIFVGFFGYITWMILRRLLPLIAEENK